MRVGAFHADMVCQLDQALDLANLLQHIGGRRAVADVQGPAEIELFDDAMGIDAVELAGEDIRDRRADELTGDVVGAA